MAKRRIAIITVLLCLCCSFWSNSAVAASTADASEPINTSQECSLTLSYECNKTPFEGVTVKLYKVASVSADFQYTLTDSFAHSKLDLNSVASTNEWNVIRSTLEARITAENIDTIGTAKTNSNGQVSFKSLKVGLYLAVVGHAKQGDISCNFDSALVALPNLDSNENWQYQISVASKSEIIPPSVNEKTLKVTKLFKGDTKKNRPKSVEVEIFKNSISYKKVVLSDENNWSYSWSVKQDNAVWSVIERNVPSDYTMTIDKRANSFVITNNYTPKTPEKPEEPPKTGDTSNIMLYVILMIVSGSLLIILGIMGKRNSNEASK